MINEAFHLQNLREAVAAAKAKRAETAGDLPLRDEYLQKAQDYTSRYTMMQKYSDYLSQYGAHFDTMSFDQWMGETAQLEDLNKKWTALNILLGLERPEGMGGNGTAGRPEVALA